MNKTKSTIFDSAIKVFSSNGYSGATMDEIAQNAGVAKGTLYYHFKSKEEIFKYIIAIGMEKIKEQIDSAIEKEETAYDKLKTICIVQLNLIYKNRDFFKVLLSQLWGQEVRQFEVREVIGNYIKYIEIFIAAAMRDGYIKEGETSFIAYNFFGNLCSAAIYELINGEKYPIDELKEKVVYYIFEGIGISK